MNTARQRQRRHPVVETDKPTAAEEVQKLVQEFWPERAPLSIETCAPIARAIDVLRRHHAAERARLSALKEQGTPRTPRPILGDGGEKYGRYFLQHLRDAHIRLNNNLTKFAGAPEHDEVLREYFGYIPEMRAAMKAAEEQVAAFLQLCANYDARERKLARPNPARFIASKLEYAWRNEDGLHDLLLRTIDSLTNEQLRPPGHEVPRSRRLMDKGPRSPLCGFVTKALVLAGINYSENYVSDLLRDRAQRPRSGKARAPGRKL